MTEKQETALHQGTAMMNPEEGRNLSDAPPELEEESRSLDTSELISELRNRFHESLSARYGSIEENEYKQACELLRMWTVYSAYLQEGLSA